MWRRHVVRRSFSQRSHLIIGRSHEGRHMAKGRGRKMPGVPTLIVSLLLNSSNCSENFISAHDAT